MSPATTTDVIEFTMSGKTEIMRSRFTVDQSPAAYEKEVIASGAVHFELADGTEPVCFQWMDKATGKTIDESFRGFVPFSGPARNLLLVIRKDLEAK